MTVQNKKRILVLTPRFPYPVIGGDRLRIYQVCKALSSHFSLTLLSLCETKNEMEMPLAEDGVFDRIERVFLPKMRSYLNTILVVPTRTPMQVGYYRSKAFCAALQNLLPEHDAVFSHLIRCGEYARKVSKPKILEMTDAISLNYDRVKKLRRSAGFKEFVYSLEADRLIKYERAIIDDFDLTVLVSEHDKQFLVGDGSEDKVLVCSNGVDLCGLPFSDRSASNPVIAYIGNMTSTQNMDACLYFAAEVMPLIVSRVNATFRVVGRISDADAVRLRGYANVEVTGAVGNIAEAVADARIGVCPVRLAAGVQNKILEYMSLGLPVITSSIGLEGLEAVSERDVLLADTPVEYASQIMRIWDCNDFFCMLSRNARAYVESSHRWDFKLQPLVRRVVNMLYNHAAIPLRC